MLRWIGEPGQHFKLDILWRLPAKTTAMFPLRGWSGSGGSEWLCVCSDPDRDRTGTRSKPLRICAPRHTRIDTQPFRRNRESCGRAWDIWSTIKRCEEHGGSLGGGSGREQVRMGAHPADRNLRVWGGPVELPEGMVWRVLAGDEMVKF